MFKIFRLIIVAVTIAYFTGCFWYMFCVNITYDANNNHVKDNFIERWDMVNITNKHKLTISCYFALTTLSTVGYGDYYPISNAERIIVVIIMLSGVAFFSYIMGQFIEILRNYEKNMGVVDKSGDLHNWLLLLTRFTNHQPLPKTLTD